MPPLDPTGRPVTVGIATLRTPGLAGVVEAATESQEPLHGSGGATDKLESALDRLGFVTQETITLSEASEVPGANTPIPRTSNDEPAIELSVPVPPKGFRQVVVAVDEAGVITWHFGRDLEDRPDAFGRADRTYFIRRHAQNVEVGLTSRGLIGRLRRKVIRVLSVRVVGNVTNYLAAKWERNLRPYSLRRFDPTNFTRWLPPGSSPDWTNLATGRALLFVHGTFSRADRAFRAIDGETFAALYAAYDQRVFAFDHPTISEDPVSNVRWLLAHIPPGIELDVDIVCHSRGGLVSRVLAEQGQQLGSGDRVRVHRTVLVAVPNKGTKLADTQYFNDLLDSFTTLANLVPVPSPWHIFEAVGAVVREIVVAGQQSLDGIDCMVPGRPFLEILNSPALRRQAYFGVSSDFDPVGGSGAWNSFKDRVVDLIHGEENDVLVAQSSAFGPNGSSSFPITPPELLVFSDTDHVDHAHYFDQRLTRDSLLGWLTPVS